MPLGRSRRHDTPPYSTAAQAAEAAVSELLPRAIRWLRHATLRAASKTPTTPAVGLPTLPVTTSNAPRISAHTRITCSQQHYAPISSTTIHFVPTHTRTASIAPRHQMQLRPLERRLADRRAAGPAAAAPVAFLVAAAAATATAAALATATRAGRRRSGRVHRRSETALGPERGRTKVRLARRDGRGRRGERAARDSSARRALAPQHTHRQPSSPHSRTYFE